MPIMGKMDKKSKTARVTKLAKVAEKTNGHNGFKVQNGLDGQFGHIDPNYQKRSKVQNAQSG